MESSAHGCALVRDQVFDDKNAVPYTQSISESQGIMAWDSASYNEDTEDEELVRKRKQLQLIEAQIASKKASIALKKGKLQQGPLCYDSDDENEPADPTGIRDTQVGTEKDSEKCSLFTNNISQKPAHQEAISLTERQISILNELTQPFLSLKPSTPATLSMKSFLEKRNKEILQRDLGQKQRFQSDLNTTFSPEREVETLRPESEALRTLSHSLPPPVIKTNPGQPSLMKHFLEKRNEEILQRDVKKKQMTKLDYNPADASEHKLEATRPHSHLQHALPSSVYNSPAEQLAPSGLNHSTRTSNQGPPSKGFDRFLSILNQGVDFGRLSNIVSAAESEVVDNKPAVSATEMYTHHETSRSLYGDRNESRDKHKEMREKERGSRSDFGDSHKHSRGWDSRRDSSGRDQGKDLRERDRDWDLRERDRVWEWKGGEGVWDSRKDGDRESGGRDRGFERYSRDRSWDKERDSRDLSWEIQRERYSDNRSCKRESDSRDRSRERDRYSNDRKWERERDSRDRGWERKRYSRDRSLELRDSLWARRDKNSDVRNAERNLTDHRLEILSPRRRSSRDRWSRNRSCSLSRSSSEDERKRSRRGQLSKINLGCKVKERFTENTYPRGRRERRRQGHHSSSRSDSSDDYSPDTHCRRHDSRDADRPPPANYSGYAMMMQHNSYDGQQHNASVQTWTNAGWRGAPSPFAPHVGSGVPETPQFTPLPLLATDYNSASYQCPLPQHPPHLGPLPQLPPPSVPTPNFLMQSVPPLNLFPPSIPSPNPPPSVIPQPNALPSVTPPCHLSPLTSTNLLPLPFPCHLTLPPPPSQQFPLPHLQQPLCPPLLPNHSFPPSTYPPLMQLQTFPPKKGTSKPNHRLADKPRMLKHEQKKRVLKVLVEDPALPVPPGTTSTSTTVSSVSTAPPETTLSTSTITTSASTNPPETILSTSTTTTSVSTALPETAIASTTVTSSTTATTSSVKTGVTRPSRTKQVVSFTDYRKREEKNLVASPFAKLFDRKHLKQLAWTITNMAFQLAATAVVPAASGGTDATSSQTTAAEQHPACGQEQEHPIFPLSLSKKLKKRIRQEKKKILKTAVNIREGCLFT